VGAERGFDRLRHGLRRRLGRVGPVEILVYRGFGTAARVTIQGRVVEAKRLEPAAAADRPWRNFVRMLHRLDSDEIPGARVRVSFAGLEGETVTDDEGYFGFELAPSALPPGEDGWHTAELSLATPVVPAQGIAHARADLLVPDAAAAFGIVSDIDDTVLQTHVTSLLRMVRVTMLGNAHTRLPFEGTTELYRALCAGPTGAARNPVFYVSKSPWNLYDLLVDFMDRHGLPRGPLLLRDLGLHPEPRLAFKLTRVAEVIATYPALPFVLVGDSGERDPEIYLEVAAAHRDRVRAIYIRDVGTKRGFRRNGAAMQEEARRVGAELLFVRHAHEALAHARARGLAR
jgi:phosphatidate phosphatase APP1